MIGIQNIGSNKVISSSRKKSLVHNAWIQLQEINKKEHGNCSPICEVEGMVEALLVSKNNSLSSIAENGMGLVSKHPMTFFDSKNQSSSPFGWCWSCLFKLLSKSLPKEILKSFHFSWLFFKRNLKSFPFSWLFLLFFSLFSSSF